MSKRFGVCCLAAVLLAALPSPNYAQRGRPPVVHPEPIRPPIREPIREPWRERAREPIRDSPNPDRSGGDNAAHDRGESEPHSFKTLFEVRGYYEDLPPYSSHSVTEPWDREKLEKVPLPELRSLNQKLLERMAQAAKPEVLAILPRGDEYKHAYGKEFSAKRDREITLASEKFGNLRLGRLATVTDDEEDEFLDRVRNSKSNVIIVVGHSSGQGPEQMIMLPRGPGLSVSSLLRASVESGHPCIIVTCHGEDLGIDDEISWTTAYNICFQASRAYEKNKSITAQDLLLVMRHEATRWAKPGVSVVFVLASATGAAGGADIVMVVADYESESKNWVLWIVIALWVAGTAAFVLVFARIVVNGRRNRNHWR